MVNYQMRTYFGNIGEVKVILIQIRFSGKLPNKNYVK